MVVAGGGPAGYSAAIALAQNGFNDIVVLEQAESADFFNPTKGYVFNISKAGQDVLGTLGIDNVRETGPILSMHVCCICVGPRPW